MHQTGFKPFPSPVRADSGKVCTGLHVWTLGVNQTSWLGIYGDSANLGRVSLRTKHLEQTLYLASWASLEVGPGGS